MDKDIKIELEFYFIFDGLIVLHSTDYRIVCNEYIKYYSKYGDNHAYYLYTLDKQNFKDIIKIKE